jgi:2-dehydro-3-deoxygluconokinase
MNSSPETFDVLTVGEPMALFTALDGGPLEGVRAWHRSVAGAELNVAIGLARLGLTVGYLSRVGQDSFGRSVLAALAHDGVSGALVRVDSTRRTGFMLKAKAVSGADPAVEYHRAGSAASHLSVADAPEDGCRYGWLHLTGVAAAVSDSLRELVFELAARARAAGRRVSFDPNLRPPLWASPEFMARTVNTLSAQADLVLPGLSEGRLLTGLDRPEEIAAWYLDQGARQVVIKLGPQGAYFAEQGGLRGQVPGVAVAKVVDTVGAGDGFAVGVISGLVAGLSLQQAAERGNRIGARVVQFPGDSDGLPTRLELDG